MSKKQIKSIGESLKAVRKSLGLTREEMASKLSISDRSLYNYERGARSPSADILLSLVEHFMVNPIWLLSGHGQMFLIEKPTRPSGLISDQKDPPYIISKRDDQDLYRLVKALKKSKPKEIARFLKMALAYFEEEKKGR